MESELDDEEKVPGSPMSAANLWAVSPQLLITDVLWVKPLQDILDNSAL